MSSKKTIKLKSSDGEVFEVEESVAMESQTIRHMIEDGCADSVIPLPKVASHILAKVIEYCRRHVQGDADDAAGMMIDDELIMFDINFVRVDQDTLFAIILAANYLDIKRLLELTCRGVAEMIQGKSPEEIRKLFNIENDFTPEEEEEVRKEHQWAFE